MLRTGDFKYVYHTRMSEEFGPEQELYNMKEDEGEFSNLAKDSRYKDKVEEMHALLVKELGREPDEAETECRADYARGYDRENS